MRTHIHTCRQISESRLAELPIRHLLSFSIIIIISSSSNRSSNTSSSSSSRRRSSNLIMNKTSRTNTDIYDNLTLSAAPGIICVHIYIYIYTHTYVHTYIHTYIYVFMC